MDSIWNEGIEGNNWKIYEGETVITLSQCDPRGERGVSFRKKKEYVQSNVMRKEMLDYLGHTNGGMKREKAKRDDLDI